MNIMTDEQFEELKKILLEIQEDIKEILQKAGHEGAMIAGLF